MINGIKLSQLFGLHGEDLIAAMLLTHPESITTFSWSAAELSEIEAFSARALRDEKLSETDWTANSDVTMTEEMTTYRQALRDIPAQDGFPNTVTWPTKP